MNEMESSVQRHAKQIEGMRERLLSLERYSREYNLLFHDNVFNLSYDPTLRPFPNKIEIRDFKRFDKIILKMKQQQHDINFEEDSEKKIPSPRKKALRNANWTPVYKSYDVNENLT